MKVQLIRKNDAVHFTATGASGISVDIDGSPTAGGENLGARPMELVLMSVGSCSAIDVVLILKKMKQPVGGIRIEVDAERDPDAVPSVFTSIVVHYFVSPEPGHELAAERVERAVSLSMEKYCSVTRMLEESVAISHRVTIEH